MDVKSLPSLDVVVKETLLLHAFLGTVLEGTAPAQGGAAEIGLLARRDGRWVFAICGSSAWTTRLRSARIGMEVEEFIPVAGRGGEEG